MKRLGLAIALSALVVTAAGTLIGSCGGGGGTTGGCQPGRAECDVNQACTASADCKVGLTCNQTTRKCEQVFVCTADSQCTNPSTSGNPACTDASKCICLEGRCQERGCSTDALCAAGKICSGGKCTDRPAAAGLTCHILTPSSVVRQGGTVTFVAVAKNANGAIVPGQSFTWTSSNTSAATIDASGVATGGSATATTNITCRVTGGAAQDSTAVVLQNYAAVAGGTVRAVVIDERTGNPVSGAQVLFEKDGATVGGAAVATDEYGIAPASAAAPISVHVFKAGYSYVSIINTSSADVLVPLLPTPDNTKAGGFKGTFDFRDVANQSDTVEFGIAGGSLSGSFINLDFEKLIGESLETHVKIGTLFDDFVGVPSGLVLKLGDQPIKPDFKALAEGGLRHAWGIGGKVPFDKLIQILTPLLGGGASVENLPFGQLIAQILPFFDKFRHFIQPDVNIVEEPKVPDTGDINGNGETTDLVPNFASNTAFKPVVARVSQALSLSTSITVPDLPRYNNAFLEGAIVLAGANVPGRGLVPLGLSAGVDAPKQNETPNGKIDVDSVAAGDQNTLTFKMAPLHSGIEGSKFFFATLAISLRFGGDVPTSISGIITQTNEVTAQTSLGSAGFLGFPETSAFNPANRQFSLTNEVPGASIYRADFQGSGGEWLVYFKKPATGTVAFTLPVPPTGFPNRAVQDCAGTPCTSLRVFSLATRQVPGCAGACTLDEVSAFGSVNLTRLNDFVGAFSNTECQESGSCAPPPAQ